MATIDFYEQNAAEFCEKHDSVRLEPFHMAVRANIKPGSKILEIGCGSGRDAAKAIADGYDVIALDGAKNLLAEAQKRHPELKGRLVYALLPTRLSFGSEFFDGFYSVACLMHLQNSDIQPVLAELWRVVKTGGRGLVSLPLCRPDINENGFDDKGRYMNIKQPKEWQELFNNAGFAVMLGEKEPDKLNREGVFWQTFILTKIKA